MRGLVATSLVLNVLGCAVLLVVLQGVRAVEQSDRTGTPGPVWKPSPEFQRAVSVHALLPSDSGDVIFAGDSQIAKCPWTELFGTTSVRNRGIDGDTVFGVIARRGALLAGPPTQLYLHVGGNDLYVGRSLATVEEGYRTLLRAFKLESPSTDVFVLSTTPMARNHTLHTVENERARALNAMLRRAVPDEGATFVDIEEAVGTGDGALRFAYTFDGGHLNGLGCRAVAEVVAPLVRQALPGNTAREVGR